MESLDGVERYTLQGGEGLFGLAHDGFGFSLLFQGAPVALFWPACKGSVAQFLIRSRRCLDVNGEIRHLRHVTDGGFDPAQPIAAQIAPLLALFSDGEYTLHYEPQITDWQVIELRDDTCLVDYRDGFYPHDWNLITTRPLASLDAARIDYYQDRIRAGVRPLVLLAGVDWVEFILDGHHKLAAYQRLEVAPSVLLIVWQELPEITPDLAREAFVDAPSFYAGYVQLKREEEAYNSPPADDQQPGGG